MSKVLNATSPTIPARPLWLSVMVDATIVALALFVYSITRSTSAALMALGYLAGSLVPRVWRRNEARGVMIDVVVVAAAVVVQVMRPASVWVFGALGYLLASGIMRARARFATTAKP